MQRRPEFSFQGSPALPPRPRTTNPMEPRSPGEEEVRWLQASRQGSPDSGTAGSGTPPSPQLWATHHHRLYPASAGSSPSRAQAIAGYRRQMLDLVRGLPESAYELSLRDIVERPSPSSPLPPPPQPSSSATDATAARDHDETADTKRDATASGAADIEEEGRKQSIGAKKQGRRKKRTAREQRGRSFGRSVSLDTGLLIKLFLPLSIGGGGGKKKVSPKPNAGKKKEEKKKQGKKKEGEAAMQDEEWWTKSEFSEAASSSRTSSTGSSNSTSSVRNGNANSSSNPRAPIRSRSRNRTGCYAFFRTNKSNNGVSQD